MKVAPLVLLAASLVIAAPSTSTKDVNPFAGRQFFVSPGYTASVQAAAANLTKRGEYQLAKKALQLTKVSTFLWVSDSASVPSISQNLAKARAVQLLTGKKQIVQYVIYNLPDRDCSAKASSGEFDLANGGEEKYKKWVNDVVAQFRKFPDLALAVQLETDAIGNIVTNQGVEKCANAAPAHKRLMSYAVAKLSELPNVSTYLDGAHAGWLGWPDNLQPTANVMIDIINGAKAINPRSRVRGISTDVSNYNNIGTGVQGSDELLYINNLTPLLKAGGFDAHFIVDQGRSGNTVDSRGTWCNWKKAGFGPRPTTNTSSPLIDAIVWVKPGGESDGTSDTSSPRYDTNCGSDDSLLPAPEAGQWFQAYFEQLLTNAQPAF